jgi:ribonucleoside-diphosphate reductase subunit M1
VSALKKRAPPTSVYMSSPSAIPRPMAYVNSSKEGSPNGDAAAAAPSTPPPIKTAALGEIKPRPVHSPSKPPAFKADVDEGDSPKALPTEPADKPPKEEELSSPVLGAKKDKDAEDKEDESKEREMDIYSEAVLACKFPRGTVQCPLIQHANRDCVTGSIENPEACIMCSG